MLVTMRTKAALTLGRNGSYLATSRGVWPPKNATHLWRMDQYTLGAGSDVNTIIDQIDKGTPSSDQAFYLAKGQLSTIGSAGAVTLANGGAYLPAVQLDPNEVFTTGAIAIVADIPFEDTTLRTIFGGYSPVGAPTNYLPLIIQQNRVGDVGKIGLSLKRSLVDAALELPTVTAGKIDFIFTFNSTNRYLFINGALAASDVSAGVNETIASWVIGTDFLAQFGFGRIIGEVSTIPSLLTASDAVRFHAYRLARYGT